MVGRPCHNSCSEILIELLRPLSWIEEHRAKPGIIINDLREMGAVGEAQVTTIEAWALRLFD
jgi:hypothetical protein